VLPYRTQLVATETILTLEQKAGRGQAMTNNDSPDGSGGGEAPTTTAVTNPRPDTAAPEPRSVRRLSDKILVAFHHACDQGDIEAAGQLVGVLDFMSRRTPNLPTGRDRRAKESLVAAHERLWHIRHPDLLGC
jgi:hypothetical protein